MVQFSGLQGLLSKGMDIGRQVPDWLYKAGGRVGRAHELEAQKQALAQAMQRAGGSPDDIFTEQSLLAHRVNAQPIGNYPGMGGRVPPMGSGRAEAAMPPRDAVRQVARAIEPGYSLLNQQQPQGEWWQQLGGFFQDNPALTQGLLTGGLGMMAGLDPLSSAGLGGQAMQARQGQMASLEQQQFARALEMQKLEIENMKAQAGILGAINQGSGKSDDEQYSEYLKEGMSLFKDPEQAQKHALSRMRGETPQIYKKPGLGLPAFLAPTKGYAVR